MKTLKLPLVEALLESYNNGDFSRVKIIGAQHILETTHAMFQAFYRFGLKPQNISIIGKCYSTCEEVFNEMIEDGIDVGKGSFAYSSHLSYDEQYAVEVHQFLEARLNDLKHGGYERIIVLDDGGKCINFLSEQLKLDTQIIAVEQTTAGYEAIKNSELLFPVINVARSPAKLKLESPMIAQAAAERLYLSLKQRKLSPKRALVIGGGAIGAAIRDRLIRDMEVVIYDQDAKKSHSTDTLENLLSSFPLIIGCTGKTSIPQKMHSLIPPETALVSVSSSDREFDAAHLRSKIKEETICHQDLMVDEKLLINSGFPVNFDGDRENIDPDKIQLTIALITAAIVQSKEQPKETLPGIFPVNEQVEQWIVDWFIFHMQKQLSAR